MKTKEQAAIEFSCTTYVTLSTDVLKRDVNCFNAGVEFAEEWIDLKEETPPFGWCFIKDDNNGKYAAAHIAGDIDINFIVANFTHWRPINRK